MCSFDGIKAMSINKRGYFFAVWLALNRTTVSHIYLLKNSKINDSHNIKAYFDAALDKSILVGELLYISSTNPMDCIQKRTFQLASFHRGLHTKRRHSFPSWILIRHGHIMKRRIDASKNTKDHQRLNTDFLFSRICVKDDWHQSPPFRNPFASHNFRKLWVYM